MYPSLSVRKYKALGISNRRNLMRGVGYIGDKNSEKAHANPELATAVGSYCYPQSGQNKDKWWKPGGKAPYKMLAPRWAWWMAAGNKEETPVKGNTSQGREREKQLDFSLAPPLRSPTSACY